MEQHATAAHQAVWGSPCGQHDPLWASPGRGPPSRRCSTRLSASGQGNQPGWPVHPQLLPMWLGWGLSQNRLSVAGPSADGRLAGQMAPGQETPCPSPAAGVWGPGHQGWATAMESAWQRGGSGQSGASRGQGAGDVAAFDMRCLGEFVSLALRAGGQAKWARPSHSWGWPGCGAPDVKERMNTDSARQLGFSAQS